MLLTGVYYRSLDEKLRTAVPKGFREAMELGDGRGVYVAPGTDQSLVLFAEEAFCNLADRLAQASPLRQDVRTFNRLFFARARRLELDSQGRVRIPSELAELARLEKEIVLLGVRDHVEIWSAERWSAYLTERQGRYDEIAETAFSQEVLHEPRSGSPSDRYA